MQREEKRKPEFETRLNGIRWAVWVNDTDGRRWYSAAPSRRVIESESKEAKYFTTFNGVADLVLLRAGIDQAIDWIQRHDDGRLAEEE